jgi:hypothetical protein
VRPAAVDVTLVPPVGLRSLAVEPRGLEPLTPCLQIALDDSRKMALTCGNVGTWVVRNGRILPLFPPQVPHGVTLKHGVSDVGPSPCLAGTT